MPFFDLPDWDPTIMGTVGQWASAIGTTFAVLAALYVIRRDSRFRRLDQAKKVALSVEEVPAEHGETVFRKGTLRLAETMWETRLANLSDEPIYEVGFYIAHHGRLVDILSRKNVVMPKEELPIRLQDPPSRHDGVAVTFRDNAGRHWKRDLDGYVTERNRFRRWMFARFHDQPPIQTMLEGRKTKRQNEQVSRERAERLEQKQRSKDPEQS